MIGKFAVTQAQWRSVAGLPKINRDLDPDPSHFKGANRPVEQVSWEEVVEFCERLSRKTGKQYRLPSEAEWEYACRASPIQTSGTPGIGEVRSAGTTTPFHFGETITTDLANYRGTDWEYQGTTYPGKYGKGPYGSFREQTTDVGSFPPNAFGLYDMHGNVWEWCADRWHENYQGAPTDGSAWMTGDSKYWLVRGGSWNSNPRVCRSAVRGRGSASATSTSVFGLPVLSPGLLSP
ncbi:MAG: formylglycine-generating enzyme family protein [Leptolyngbyaceae cyanobacterium]